MSHDSDKHTEQSSAVELTQRTWMQWLCRTERTCPSDHR